MLFDEWFDPGKCHVACFWGYDFKERISCGLLWNLLLFSRWGKNSNTMATLCQLFEHSPCDLPWEADLCLESFTHNPDPCALRVDTNTNNIATRTIYRGNNKEEAYQNMLAMGKKTEPLMHFCLVGAGARAKDSFFLVEVWVPVPVFGLDRPMFQFQIPMWLKNPELQKRPSSWLQEEHAYSSMDSALLQHLLQQDLPKAERLTVHRSTGTRANGAPLGSRLRKILRPVVRSKYFDLAAWYRDLSVLKHMKKNVHI